MIIHELSDAECLEVLSRATYGRLACARDGQPYIVPISFYFDGTAGLYSVSTVGQKIQWMRDNPRVCVEADDISDRFHWTSVVVTGTYEELGGPDSKREDLRRAFEFLQQHAEWWLPAAGNVPSRANLPRNVVVFRVRMTAVSGRRTARTS